MVDYSFRCRAGAIVKIAKSLGWLTSIACFAISGPATNAEVADSLQSSNYATPEGLTHHTYRLWKERAPGAMGDLDQDIPRLTLFEPYKPQTGTTAIIIAPGGAYIGLAYTLEGANPAAWFSAHGIKAFVLTYRVSKAARLPTVLEDGARAVQFVRAHAKEFGIDPNKIGMMGFSAGGHLAASTAGLVRPGKADAFDPVDQVSSRPDFLVLGYPWLEGMRIDARGHSQYCDFATQAKIACKPADYHQYQPVNYVTKGYPPTFIYHTSNDGLVPVGSSIRFYQALVDNGVSAELHTFAHGPHGTGWGGADASLAAWPELLGNWLRAQGLMTQPDTAKLP